MMLEVSGQLKSTECKGRVVIFWDHIPIIPDKEHTEKAVSFFLPSTEIYPNRQNI